MHTSPKFTKPWLVFFILFFQVTDIYAQHTKNIQMFIHNVTYTLDSGYYDSELRVGLFQNQVKNSIFSKLSKKLVEEFYMISDTSVCFVGYDGNMNVISIGVFVADRYKPANYNLLSIPDIANDPYGEKGLAKDWLCENCIWPLKKEGLWIENSATGYYSGGMRTGSWEFGKSVIHINKYEPMSISTNSISIYRNGKIENTTHVGSHFNDGSKKLAGRWFIEQNRTDSSLFLCRRPYNFSELGFVDFYSSYSYQDNYFPASDGNIYGDSGKWEVNGNILGLTKKGRKSKYKLEDFNEAGVILRKIK